MAALNASHNFPPRANYSTSHRPPPAIPSVPYATVPAREQPRYELESATSPATQKRGRQRGSSFGQLFRLNSSNTRLHSQQNPGIPSTKQAPAPPAATAALPPPAPPDAGRKRSFSASRKTSTEGRNMLRKSSRKREEAERLEQERKARMNAPAPTLELLHEPDLPGIVSFDADNLNLTTATNHTAPSTTSPPRSTNFSRPAVGMPASNHSTSSPAAYAISPPSRANGEYVADPMARMESTRSESMTHRGRYSYASSIVSGNVSSPRRVRRRKDPTPFNILVIGAKNSGKTSFISLLRHSLASANSNVHTSIQPESTINGPRASFTSHYLETTMDGERVGITVWDSAGLEKNIVDLQLREMAAFVESKFEETFAEEQKVVRSPGVKDTHIHCVFLVLDPVRLDSTVAVSSAQQKNGISLSNVSGLDDDLDLQALRVLWGKTTVIPVISKADTLTIGHMAFLKRAVWDSVKAARLDPLEALELEDDMAEKDEEDEDDDEVDHTEAGGAAENGHNDDSSDDHEEEPNKPTLPKSRVGSHKRHSSLSASIKSSDDETPYIPMSILSPDPHDLPPFLTNTKLRNPKDTNVGKVGRRFAWGFADPYNADHCDFTRLRDSVFSEWRAELRDLSKSKWYENWRTSRLKHVVHPTSTPVMPKQRVKGGVTPVNAVPQGGLISRNFAGSGAVPRMASAPGGMMAMTSPAVAELPTNSPAGVVSNGGA